MPAMSKMLNEKLSLHFAGAIMIMNMDIVKVACFEMHLIFYSTRCAVRFQRHTKYVRQHQRNLEFFNASMNFHASQPETVKFNTEQVCFLLRHRMLLSYLRS